MTYLIGIDEAGYGPNLGPLVLAATCWHAPEKVVDRSRGDLYEPLAQLVTRVPRQGDPRIVIADSKAVYQSRQGLGRLESSVLAAVTVCHGAVGDGLALWDCLGADGDGQRAELPWGDRFGFRLPVAAAAARVAADAGRLGRGLPSCGIHLVGIEARTLFPAAFNRAVERHGTKSDALSHASLGLLADVLRAVGSAHGGSAHGGSGHGGSGPGGPGCGGSGPGGSGRGGSGRGGFGRVCVTSDKHGGRNRYRHLLAEHFPAADIRTEREGRQASVYWWEVGGQRVEVQFVTRGEAHLPVALASMMAKYLRELAMRIENEFWCERIPHLRPTAGYPVDARRFKAEIAPCQQALAIDDRLVWRTR